MIKEYSVDHENALLGAMMLDPSVYDDLEVCTEWFKQPVQKRIAQAIERVIIGGGKPDIINVWDLLKGGDLNPGIITKMTSSVPSSANAGYYAEILKRNHEFCQLEALRPHLDDWLKCGDAAEVLFNLDKYITSITDNEKSGVDDFRKQLHKAIDQVEKSYNSKKELDGLSTGYRSLDLLLCGIQDGDFVIIGARPSIGKTTLMMNLVINIASLNIPVGVFTLEMRGVSLAKREIAARARINFSSVRIGKITTSEFGRIVDQAGFLGSLTIYIDDTAGITITRLWQRARQMKRKGVKIIFVDYLSLIRHPNQNKPRHEQMSEISQALKNIGRELNIPIVALSQLTRTAENKMPLLSDLRESGSLEQDADSILFLHRERDSDETQIIVAKQRNGATGTVKMLFKREILRFEELYVGKE